MAQTGPEPPAGAASNARLRWIGVGAGVLAYLLFMAADFANVARDRGAEDYRGLTYVVLALVGTPLLLLLGGLLTINPRLRPFAIGLLIGVGVGVVAFGGVCVAVITGSN
jgi:hypothetical protein